MRLLIPLLVAGLLGAAEAEVPAYLSGSEQQVPSLSTAEEVAAALPLIDAALHAGGPARVRAFSLVGNLGPEAAPIVTSVLAAYRDLPANEQRYSADAVAALGPLAEQMLKDGVIGERPAGMSWTAALRLAPDPAPLLPRLLADLGGNDRVAVIAAAQGLTSIPWCPEARAAKVLLEEALHRFAETPPPGPVRSFLVCSWASEDGDPDNAEIFDRQITRLTPQDPWPALLAALAALAPKSPVASAAALAHLTQDSAAHRRQAALLALADLHTELNPRDLATQVEPWLGAGPRGRMAMRVLARCGEAAPPVLEALPPDRRAAQIAAISSYRLRDDSMPMLPESWIEILLVSNASRKGGALAYAGAAGIERILADRLMGDVAFLTWGTLPVPLREPQGLVDLALAAHGEIDVARSLLCGWWHAPWMPAVASRLRTIATTDRLTITLAALLAANGDRDALAWLRAQPARLDSIDNNNGWILFAEPALLPADLATRLPHPAPQPATPRMSDAEMRAALARLRRGSPGDAVDLLAAGRCRDEASWFVTRLRFGGTRHTVGSISSAGVRSLVTPVSLNPMRRSSDPLVRRLATLWGQHPPGSANADATTPIVPDVGAPTPPDRPSSRP